MADDARSPKLPAPRREEIHVREVMYAVKMKDWAGAEPGDTPGGVLGSPTPLVLVDDLTRRVL